MWILVTFDVPSESGYSYRRLRKFLISNGFSFFQCSVCWRWVHSREKMEALRHNIEKVIPPGKMLFVCLPEASFAAAFCWNDQKLEKMPDPPDPWIVL